MTIFIMVMLVVGFAVLIGSIITGLLTFSPDRAKAVRAAEAQQQTMVEQMVRTHHYLPDFRCDGERLDRHPSYVWINMGLWLYGCSILFRTGPNPNLTVLSNGTQYGLRLCMLLGATFALVGASLGVKVLKWRIAPWIHNNFMAPLLGDDIRLPYGLACAGMVSTIGSMSIYVYALLLFDPPRLLTPLGGSLALGIIIMCLILITRMVTEILDYIRARERLITEAIGRIQESGQ